MPRESIATEFDIQSIKMFVDAAAHARLTTLHNEGKEVKKVESSFEDVGDDYVDFKVGDEVICHIPGY